MHSMLSGHNMGSEQVLIALVWLKLFFRYFLVVKVILATSVLDAVFITCLKVSY